MSLHQPHKAKDFSPWFLGAPLYMPAHRRDIIEIANGEKYSQLRAMIFCTEDAVLSSEVTSSLRHLGLCLQGFKTDSHQFRFIRARNPEILARLLDLPQIEKIDGFVLPKFNAEVFQAYFDLLQGTHFKVMPTLETKEVFDHVAMCELRAALLQEAILPRVIMLRIGGNDLMNLLGLRRPRNLTLYDTPLRNVICQLVSVFKPYGFSLSAPVFEYLADNSTLQKEIQLDLAHGLTGKTAIHPTQVPFIEAAYGVESEDYDMALKLRHEESPAVFRMHDAMCEMATHQQWAEAVLSRQSCYGIKGIETAKDCVEVSV